MLKLKFRYKQKFRKYRCKICLCAVFLEKYFTYPQLKCVECGTIIPAGTDYMVTKETHHKKKNGQGFITIEFRVPL